MQNLHPIEVDRLVLVSPYVADHNSLQWILDPLIWRFHGFFTVRDCLDFVRNRDDVAVVICNKRLPDGDWSELMEKLASVRIQPVFIVSARLADERLWAEVLNWGAFDVLTATPFDREEVIRVTESAWIAWNRTCGRSVLPRTDPILESRGEAVKVKAQAAGRA